MSAFCIKAYSKKELSGHYEVSAKTFAVWLKAIVGLGKYNGRKFTPKQVKMIIDHVGPPSSEI